MKHEDVQLSELERVVPGIYRPDCFTGILVAPLSRDMSITPWNRVGKNECQSSSSTGRKASPTLRVTLWEKSQICYEGVPATHKSVYGDIMWV